MLSEYLIRQLSWLQDTITASLFLASKLLETPSNPQNIINVLLNLLNHPLPGLFTQPAQAHQDALFATEMHILKSLGFQVEIKLPYSLAINYLQILGLSNEEEIPQRVWNYCNDMYPPEFLMVCWLKTPNAVDLFTYAAYAGLYGDFLDGTGFTG